jgi:hypothetical protein
MQRPGRGRISSDGRNVVARSQFSSDNRAPDRFGTKDWRFLLLVICVLVLLCAQVFSIFRLEKGLSQLALETHQAQAASNAVQKRLEVLQSNQQSIAGCLSEMSTALVGGIDKPQKKSRDLFSLWSLAILNSGKCRQVPTLEWPLRVQTQ